MKYLIFLFLPFFFLFMHSCVKKNTWTVNSPDGKISATIFIGKSKNPKYSEKLFYEINYISNQDNELIHSVIEPSRLGIDRDDQSFHDSLKVRAEHVLRVQSEKYELRSGKKLLCENTANELTLFFKNKKNKSLNIVFRVFNDGVAFRYEFPDTSKYENRILNEYTEFNLPVPGKKWIQPYDNVASKKPAYEENYFNGIEIGKSAPLAKNGWAFPVLFKTDSLWVFVSESNVGPTNCAMHLKGDARHGVYRMRFPEPQEAMSVHPQLPESNLPWLTPWRVIIIGTELADIVESNLVTDVADRAKYQDISWIEPGRSSWSWWSSKNGRSVERIKRFIDLSYEMNWEYTLVDAGWDNMPDGTLEDIIDYADQKEIGLLLWYNSAGFHNDVAAEPRDLLSDKESRVGEFERISDLGVAGIKVDFFSSDKQGIMKLYHDILNDASDFDLVVNFHGSTLPWGWQRTYPHLLTMEAVRGGEAYRYNQEFTAQAPVLNTIIPFTRNLVGPVDYTPVILSDNTFPHITTYAHELATAIVFESGLVHFPDSVEAYLGLPDFARKFLSELPVTWDDTKLIDGYPGSHVVLARRKADEWYIAGIQSGNSEMEIEFNLAMIGAKTYAGEFIEDGTANRELAFDVRQISKENPVSLTLKPYGGFILHVK